MRFLLWFEPERATIHTPIVNEHPEYFPLVDGKRVGGPKHQLCITNPELRQAFLAKLLEYIRKGANGSGLGANVAVGLARIGVLLLDDRGDM